MWSEEVKAESEFQAKVVEEAVKAVVQNLSKSIIDSISVLGRNLAAMMSRR